MKRIGFIVSVIVVMVALVLAALPVGAASPDWSIDEPPSGDFATKGITYLQPGVTTGKAWFLTHGNVIPCGMNGGYPGGHEVYVDTYNPDLWPSDEAVALHVPAPGVKVAYWCSGESNPSPQNEHWVLLPTWKDGIIDSTQHGVDFPLYQQNTCRVAVYNSDGYPSAIVSNIHTRHADDTECAERDRNYGHWSYVLHFTLVDLDELATPTIEPTSTPTPQPTSTATATPEIVTEDVIRNAAWRHVYPSGGIDYNPNAAFQAIARARGLGVPVTQEFDIGSVVRVQGFAEAILWAYIGQWGDVSELAW